MSLDGSRCYDAFSVLLVGALFKLALAVVNATIKSLLGR